MLALLIPNCLCVPQVQELVSETWSCAASFLLATGSLLAVLDHAGQLVATQHTEYTVPVVGRKAFGPAPVVAKGQTLQQQRHLAPGSPWPVLANHPMFPQEASIVAVTIPLMGSRIRFVLARVVLDRPQTLLTGRQILVEQTPQQLPSLLVLEQTPPQLLVVPTRSSLSRLQVLFEPGWTLPNN